MASKSNQLQTIVFCVLNKVNENEKYGHGSARRSLIRH